MAALAGTLACRSGGVSLRSPEIPPSNAVGLPSKRRAAKDGADGFARPPVPLRCRQGWRRQDYRSNRARPCGEPGAQEDLARDGQLQGASEPALGTDPIGPNIMTIGDNLDAVNMTPDAALEEYGLMILKVRAVYNAVFKNKLVRSVPSRHTGARGLVDARQGVLPRVSPPKGEPDYDLVIVDAPATGHALDMLRVPFVIESVAPARNAAARCGAGGRDVSGPRKSRRLSWSRSPNTCQQTRRSSSRMP